MKVGRLEIKGLLPFSRREGAGYTIQWRTLYWRPEIAWHGKLTFDRAPSLSAKQLSQPKKEHPND